MEMKIPPKPGPMNHQAWEPGSCHSCLVWPGLREGCVRTGQLACSLEQGAMTSHLIQPQWAGHPGRLFYFIFEDLYLTGLGLGHVEISAATVLLKKSFLSKHGKI